MVNITPHTVARKRSAQAYSTVLSTSSSTQDHNLTSCCPFEQRRTKLKSVVYFRMKVLSPKFFLIWICSVSAFAPSSLQTRKHKLEILLPLFSGDPDNKLDSQSLGKNDKFNGVASTSSSTSTIDQQEQLKDINKLIKQKEQRETAINRLKFQINELRATADESEKNRIDAEKKVEELTRDSDIVRKKNKDLYDELREKLR